MTCFKIYRKAYPSFDGISLYGMNFVDCVNSDVYNSQLIIKIKRKNDTQSRVAKTQREALLTSNLNGLLR